MRPGSVPWAVHLIGYEGRRPFMSEPRPCELPVRNGKMILQSTGQIGYGKALLTNVVWV